MRELAWSTGIDVSAWLWGGMAILGFAVAGWLLSLMRKNVSFVDSMWSLMFLLALSVYLLMAESVSWRGGLVFGLVALWALRLCAHITIRNHGQPEDRRYQAIRANNQPNFEFKSLYIVFGLQGFLAWVICLPALAAVSGQTSPGPLDYAGVGLWLIGMFFEVLGDLQLARFKSRKETAGEVLDTGLWRYTRHPNYFGEFTLWWGVYLLALSAGAGWTIFAPLIMSFLLLRVSGVTLLEKDIGQRRPDYRDYIQRTNAFFPGKPRASAANIAGSVSALALCALLLGFTGTPLRADPLSGGDQLLKPAMPLVNEWRFRVFVDDKEVGYHDFYLQQQGANRVLRSIAEFKYKLAFITLYSYEHENIEEWQGDCLASIESSTDANGKPFAVLGQRNDTAFTVMGNTGQNSLPPCVMSFAYWNPAFLEQEQLLNSQNGEYLDVRVSGPERVGMEVLGQTRSALHYRLEAGPLKLQLWYSDRGEWLGLESETESGRTLRYELL